MQIQGYFDLKFEALKDTFAELFNDPQQRGGALCVQIGGETVLDLWAGVADKDGQQAWHSDTILNLFSCTKTFTAVTALQLVGEGKLELDAPVARYWPEFAAAGKEKITLRHLLSHTGGLLDYEDLMPTAATAQVHDIDVLHLLEAQDRTLFAPGSRYRYSNSGYALLALVTTGFATVAGSVLAAALLRWRLDLDPGGLYATGLLTAALVSVVSLSLGARYLHAQLKVNPAVLLRSS